MRWLLDTNVWIDAHAGQAGAGRVFVKAQATQSAWIGFSAITKVQALGYSAITTADDKALRELFSQFEELPVLTAVLEEAIRLRRAHKLKTPDAIIAATAFLQKAEVVTRNTADFKKVAGLSVLETQSF